MTRTLPTHFSDSFPTSRTSRLDGRAIRALARLGRRAAAGVFLPASVFALLAMLPTSARSDDRPYLGLNSPSVQEGDSGTTTLTFTARLTDAKGRTKASDKTITANYQVLVGVGRHGRGREGLPGGQRDADLSPRARPPKPLT